MLKIQWNPPEFLPQANEPTPPLIILDLFSKTLTELLAVSSIIGSKRNHIRRPRGLQESSRNDRDSDFVDNSENLQKCAMYYNFHQCIAEFDVPRRRISNHFEGTIYLLNVENWLQIVSINNAFFLQEKDGLLSLICNGTINSTTSNMMPDMILCIFAILAPEEERLMLRTEGIYKILSKLKNDSIKVRQKYIPEDFLHLSILFATN